MQNKKIFPICACLLLLTGVQLGALGSHALDDILTPSSRNSWELAVQYQLLHALGLLVLALLREKLASKLLVWASSFMLVGIILFSGSIYLSALKILSSAAQIAPFGGSALMLAWLLTAVAIFRS